MTDGLEALIARTMADGYAKRSVDPAANARVVPGDYEIAAEVLAAISAAGNCIAPLTLVMACRELLAAFEAGDTMTPEIGKLGDILEWMDRRNPPPQRGRVARPRDVAPTEKSDG